MSALTVGGVMADLIDRLRLRSRPPWTPPSTWIDIHSHVLPEVDDGAASLDEALGMVARAEALGITHLVATPHYSDTYAPSWDRIDHACAELRQALADRGSSVTFMCGREVSFTDRHVAAVRDDPRFQIGHDSRCVLFELSGALNRTALIHGFFDLLIGGVRPIAAHPERNLMVQDHPTLVSELRARGVLIQVDAGSLTGRHGRAARTTALALLQNGEVDFLSSDAHRVSHFDDLQRAVQRVYRRCDAATLQKVLCDVPKQVLNL